MMMDKVQHRRKNWGWILLGLAVVLPCIWWIGNQYMNSPKVSGKLIQRSVTKVEQTVTSLIESNADYHQYDKAEIGLYVFHNDSLLYWNNNLVGPRLIRRKVAMENDTILNLLTGDYYVKSFSKGNLNYYAFKLLNTTYRLENQYFENRFLPLQGIIKSRIIFDAQDGIVIRSSEGKTLTHCQIEPKPQRITKVGYLLIGLDVILAIIGILLQLPQREQDSKRQSWFKLEYGLGIIIVAASLFTYLYYEANRKRENEEMAALAERLLEKRDTAFETAYEHFTQELKADTRLREMVFAESNVLSDVVIGYSKELLFDTTMQAYEVALTICSPNEEIAVQPEDYVTNCDDYFLEKLANTKQSRVGDGLYFIDYYTLDPNYLGRIKLESPDTLQCRTLYFEFYKPIAPEGFGFPQLLQETHSQKPYAYSVANYRDNVLVYKYGKYIYPNFFTDQKGKDRDFYFSEGYKHYTLKKDENNILVISTLRKGWTDITAPFGIFVIALLIPYLLVFWHLTPQEKRLSWKGSFKQRLQATVLITIGFSLLVIGPVSGIFMSSLYNQKTMEAQYETTRTLANEMKNDVDFEELIGVASRETWTQILQHYAQIFFTDLNLYSLDGKLMATTRQEIYELTLQAPIMNAKAYQNMHRNKALYYTHREELGKGKYESAYIPINDKQGNTLAYLNTPYFSSRTDLQNEIKTFFMTYTNIILVLLCIALVLVLTIINKAVTQPLALLREKMHKTKYGQKNEPIEWQGNDEIGALIKQYNQLIVELEKSAAELKRTTAESAWRGVARQVAHEIKNPLTPMRLSIQLLQHKINTGKATPEEIQRTTTTFIEQIDALSDIASSFSRYAKLPNHPVPLDLVELVGNVVHLYDNEENITFTYIYDEAKDHTYNGDKTNLNSAVGNIIKNAVQAIGSKPDGKIEVTLKADEKQFTISVKDNGKGIKDEDKDQIFLPNFTTKTGGSGIGLSLTYNIVQAAGGKISFESQVGEGTEFVIELPK